eukprot:2019598-Prorocentrum_lima.AAC.1
MALLADRLSMPVRLAHGASRRPRRAPVHKCAPLDPAAKGPPNRSVEPTTLQREPSDRTLSSSATKTLRRTRTPR